MILKVENLTKNYGEINALKEISFEVPRGEIFALLGQNGAGKTTLLKIILDLLSATSGQVTLMGLNSLDPLSRKSISYLPEKYSFFEFDTLENILHFMAEMKGLSVNDRKSSVKNALEACLLGEIKHRKIKTLSKGQIQKIGLASLLIGENDLIFLDEPFSGLDPIAIDHMKTIMQDLARKGVTIFINTHILSEAETFCTSIGIIDRGRCLKIGKLKELISNDTLSNYFIKLINNND